MKINKKSILSFTVAACMTLMLKNAVEVSAATKEDVIAAAREAGFSEVYIQQGINYLEANPGYTSDDYDRMIVSLNNYAASVDKSIDQYFQNKPPVNDPVVTEPPAQQTEPSQSGEQTEPVEQTKPVKQPEAPEKDYASMTPEEKKDYIAGLTNEQKNQILKDLDKDQQLEIINGLIDAGSALGMNVTVDELTGDKITYSVRNDDGKIVDNASMGVIIDDTGINYTALILSSLGVILLSASGLIFLSLRQKHKKNNEN